MDQAWWGEYLPEVVTKFEGELATLNQGTNPVPHYQIKGYGNSGAGAISLAIARGATRVILLGYDLKHSQGKRHWHGNHPASLANAGAIHTWPSQFAQLRRDNPSIEIINCSRATALTAFPRMTLEEALN
ncbi:MAG: hypothetical protein Q8L20_10790 [Gammaproteobacteria bacterium]|nr:hypothetical protein [Gammaproteobacteria bacterium]